MQLLTSAFFCLCIFTAKLKAALTWKLWWVSEDVPPLCSAAGFDLLRRRTRRGRHLKAEQNSVSSVHSERRMSSRCCAASARRSLSTFTHQTAGIWNRDRHGAGDWLARFQCTEDVSILRREREWGCLHFNVGMHRSWNDPAALTETVSIFTERNNRDHFQIT